MRSLGVLIAVVISAAGCGHHGGGDDGSDTSIYDSIEVDPPLATLTVPLGATATQDYTVYGVIGTKRTDITSKCSLAIDSEFGSFMDATVTVGPHGGKTPVLAACGMLTASGELVVNLTGTIVVGPNTPPNAPDLFDHAMLAMDPARSSAIEYPIDHAVSPRNIPPIDVQWSGGGNDLFHLHLTSSFAAVDVYTSDLDALMSAVDWDHLAGTAAGGDLAIAIEGLAQATPTIKYPGTGATITMSHDTIDKTAIYYWASSQGNIMSQTFGDTSAPQVVKNDCTSCHSVSRSGTRIGYSRCVAGSCGNLYAGFMRYDSTTHTWAEPVNANAMQIHGSYTTFAPVGYPFPTDDQSLAMVSMANGTLALYDPDTGAAVPSNLDVATHGPGAPRSALMADWSANGKQVVFASTPGAGQWIDLNGGSIGVMSYTYTGGQHVFGEPTFPIPNPITLPSGTYTNMFFPSFSADGSLIVFNAARSSWRNFTNARTAGQRLMLADAAGAWVTDLPALNGPADADITWPHWAPTVSNDYYWVVFSSERDYGHKITSGNTAPACVSNGVKQCKQLWLGAIAKNKLSGTVDPSAPPMWLPGQDIQADNISPYWSVPAGLQ